MFVLYERKRSTCLERDLKNNPIKYGFEVRIKPLRAFLFTDVTRHGLHALQNRTSWRGGHLGFSLSSQLVIWNQEAVVSWFCGFGNKTTVNATNPGCSLRCACWASFLFSLQRHECNVFLLFSFGQGFFFFLGSHFV